MRLNKLQKKIGISFKDDKLLIQALTHKSFDTKNNYEKLEFLGDRVLGLCISKRLLEIFPDQKEGILDKKLASLVNKNKCYEIGKELQLDSLIKIGNLRLKKNIAEKKIISDSCEALIGAIYLDKGFKTAKDFILNKWSEYLKSSNFTIVDSKTSEKIFFSTLLIFFFLNYLLIQNDLILI